MNQHIFPIDYAWCHGPWPVERIEAVEAGYTHIFVTETGGRYRCLSNPACFYTPDQIRIREVAIPELHLTLVLVAPLDGYYNGTTIQYNAIY